MRVKGYRRKTKSGKVADVREFERRGMAARGKTPSGKQPAAADASGAGNPQAETVKYVKKAAGMVMSALIQQGLKRTPNGWVGFEKVDYRKAARQIKAKAKGMTPDDPRFQAVVRVLKDLKALNDRYGDGRGLKEPVPPAQGATQPWGQPAGQTPPQTGNVAPPTQATKAVEEEQDKEPDTEPDKSDDIPSGEATDQETTEDGAQAEPEVAPEEYVKEFQDHVVAVQRRKYESFVSHKAEKFGDKLIVEGVNDYIIAKADLVSALFSEDPTVAYMIRAEYDRHGENILKRVLSRIGAVPYMVEPIAMTLKGAKGHITEEIETGEAKVPVGRRYMFCLGFKPESENQAKALLRVLVQAAKSGTGREVDEHSGRKPFVISNVLDGLPGAVKVKIYAKAIGGQMVMSVNKGAEQKWDREDLALIYAKGPIQAEVST